MKRVELYTKGYCGYCARAKMLLDQQGIDYVEYDVQFDSARMDEMRSRADGRRTVPQIFIDGEGVGGYTELARLAMRGELTRILEPKEAVSA
jgi:glutaredoxin 3